MKYFGLAFLLCLVVLTGCAEKPFARYVLKSGSLEWVPDYSQPVSFRSAMDTIAMSELTSGRIFVETDLPSPIPSGEVDKVEAEQLLYYAVTDTPLYLVEYQLISVPDASARSGSYDQITINIRDETNQSFGEIVLENRDSLLCITPGCRYADTLVIDSINYFDVYYLAEDASKPNLYINRSEGIVAFRDQQLKTYQNIK